MILYCTACRYTFSGELDPATDCRCPDCGKFAVRLATSQEITDYERIQREIEQEALGKHFS